MAAGANFSISTRCENLVSFDASVVITKFKSQCFAKLQDEAVDTVTAMTFGTSESDAILNIANGASTVMLRMRSFDWQTKFTMTGFAYSDTIGCISSNTTDVKDILNEISTVGIKR